jgi:uncharacterized membrane protein
MLAALLACGTAQPAFAAGSGVSGRVVGLNEKGVPLGSIKGATVQFLNKAGKPAGSATTDKKGYYKVNLAPGTYTYKVHADGYKDEDAHRAITLALSEGYAVHNVALIRGKNDPNKKAAKLATGPVGTLTGHVVEKAGTAQNQIAGATIALRKIDAKMDAKPASKAPTQVTTKSDDPKQKTEKGSYEVVLDAGTYEVAVTAPGYATVKEKLTLTSGQTLKHDFVLTRGKQTEPTGQGIKGALKFADGKGPPNKLKVTVRSLSDASFPVTPLTLGSKGNYQRDLRAGRYQIMVEAEGYKSAISETKDVFAGKYTVADVRLLPAVTTLVKDKELAFTATVFERVSGKSKPLPGALVQVRKEGAPLASAVKGTTGPDGKVSMKVQGPGNYQAFATLAGFKFAGVPAEVKSTGDNHVDIELVREVPLVITVPLHMRVVEGKDSPVAGAKVVISQNGKAVKSGTSDPKGLFTESLSPGTYHVEVNKPGYKPATANVNLAKEMTQSIVLTGPVVGVPKLNLHVVERLKTMDRPIAGAEIVISQNDKRVGGGKSGTDGKLTTPLAPGTYMVAVTKPAYKPAGVKVVVGSQDTNQGVVMFGIVTPPKKSTLNLRVVEKLKTGDKAIPGAEVVISLNDKRLPGDYKTGNDGKLAVQLLPGEYTVTVNKAGFKSATVKQIIGTQDANRDIVLTRALKGGGAGATVREAASEVPSPTLIGRREAVPNTAGE